MKTIRLYTDHYFHIGGMHLNSGKPCQDYAISGVHDDVALAVISDGCSTGRHTDVGSRVLALSTATAIREHWIVNRNTLGKTVSQEVNLQQKIVLAGVRQTLGLLSSDMLATCIYAYISPKGGIVHVQGDGVVALKYRDGRISLSNFEWENNTPYYPAYQGDGLQNFIKAHGDDLSVMCLSEEKITTEVGIDFPESQYQHYMLKEGIRGITIDISAEVLSSELEFIAIFSDGVTQIDSLDWREAVLEFLSFKNVRGEFAKRRMIRGIKDSKKIGKGPSDDISCAVVRIETIEDEES